MPLSPFPLPGADLFNAGNALRDRGKYLRSGTFTWLPAGSNGFIGTVVGYAPYSANDDVVDGSEAYAGGSIGIDGGTAHRVRGSGPIAVNRWSAGSVQVNGGVAWGVAHPAGGNLPGYAEVTAAVDRMHKDGAWATVSHEFDYGSTSPGGFNFGLLNTGLDIVNQGGGGIVTAANLWMKMNSWSSGQSFSSALDFYIDGAYRFSLVNGARAEQAQSSNANGWRGTNGSFGFVRFASSLRVQMRRGSDNGQRIEATVLFITGA